MKEAVTDDLKRGLMPLFIFLIILTEGFITISVEILAIRQLIPFAGNSVSTTSLIIGVFLLFLAYGYRQGGKYQADFWKILSRNFCIACPLIGIGLSYPFLDLFFYGAKHIVGTNLYYSLTLYLILIIAPTVYILGQTVPITMNLIKANHLDADALVGTIGGHVLHISTIGSFLGAVFTALCLMNWLGVANTVFINFLLLVLLVTIISILAKFGFKRILAIALLTFVVYKFNITYEQIAFIKTNHYANYAVVEDREQSGRLKGHIFKINNSLSSFLDADLKGYRYIELVKKILFKDLGLKNKEILLVGAGGFSLTAAGTLDNHITYLDIDPNLPEIAIGHFIPKINGKFTANDARTFFLTNTQKYDAIFSDVYSNMHEIPSHLVTQQYFQQVKNALKPDGYGLFNIISQATLDNPYAIRMDNTIRSVFPHCMSIPIQYNTDITNIIYICKNTSNNDNGIYTDDLNTAQWDLASHPLAVFSKSKP